MKRIIYALMSFAPSLALAQQANLSGIDRLVQDIGRIVARIIPIMFALALIYFFWGLIQYIRSAGDPAAASKGKSIMIYGVIAIAVMVSIYGLVNWLTVNLNIQQNAPIQLPTVPGLPTP